MKQQTFNSSVSLEAGRARQLVSINDDTGGGGAVAVEISSDADRLALFLSIVSITGSVSVSVVTKENLPTNVAEMPVTSFPVQTAPTSSYLRIVTPILVFPFTVKVVYTGSIVMSLFGKAVNSIEAADVLEVSIGDKTTPVLQSQSLTIPGTWVTLTLPSGTRDLELIADPPVRLNVRFSASDFPEYWPVPAGNTFSESFLATNALTSVQVQAVSSPTTVRVKAWKDN